MSYKVSINIITLKISHNPDNSELLRQYQYDYSKLLRFTYNRVKDSNNSLSQKELRDKQLEMNNQPLDSYFMNYAQYEARAMHTSDKTHKNISRVFGGKLNNQRRSKKLISKEEYNENRLLPITCIGNATNNGNCKVQIVDLQTILFKPTKKDHIFLHLKGLSKNYKGYIEQLIYHQEKKDLPITYKIDQNYVYISFDLNKLEPVIDERIWKKDRIFAIDLNPNYIGYTVCDWKESSEFKIQASGSFSLKFLNDKDYELRKKHTSSTDPEKIYYTNKRKYEIVQICKRLIKLAIHYQCESFVMEDLSISSKDNGKGKRLNKLINTQWCRNLLQNQIRKRCSLNWIELFEVAPNYSSFVGNLAYRKYQLPDYCLSSIEIGRRGYEFNHQYKLKDKKKEKNIILNTDPEILKAMILSLEELNFSCKSESILELYDKVKKSGLQYRFQLTDCNAVFSKFYLKRLWEFNTF